MQRVQNDKSTDTKSGSITKRVQLDVNSTPDNLLHSNDDAQND